MRLIDQYAYTNKLAKASPAAKAGLAALVIVLCLGLNVAGRDPSVRPISALLAILWMSILTVGIAGIPMSVFRRLLFAQGGFLLLTSIGIGVSVSLSQPNQPWQFSLGSLWFSSSPESLNQMILLVSRALGAASALNFLALTTPLIDMVGLMRKMRMPEAIIDIMVIMYRFIFVLLDTLDRMVTAQTSRLGFQTGYWRQMQNTGQLGARLFINALSRAERLETAAAARGFNGTMRMIERDYRPFPNYALWLTGITLTLVGARWLA